MSASRVASAGSLAAPGAGSGRSTRSRVITEPLGGSALSLAIQNRRLPAGLQPWAPANDGEWRAHVTRTRDAWSKRGAWLDALAPALSATGAARERLSRVAGGRGIVVTTGQQPGLFGGPVYTLSKAITALALADAIEQRFGIPSAPVFWAATDDADFLEAAITYAADADGLHTMRLTKAPPAGTPMADAKLHAEIADMLAQLRRACGSAAHAAYFEAAAGAFTPGRMLGEAYVQLLRALLEPLGMAVLDASHEACREMAKPLLVEALARATGIAAAGASRVKALEKAGFEPQVQDDRGLSLVFVNERGGKRRLAIEEAGKQKKRRGALSPNVLLRPIVERELLPTVAYVGGPAEVAYFVQTAAVAEALGRGGQDAPVALPRWSCTIIEPFAERALGRLGVEYRELSDRAALERRLAGNSMPPEVARAWSALGEDVRAAVERLKQAVAAEKLLPAEVIEGLGRSLGQKLGRGERRLLAAVKRREEGLRRDIDVAAAAFFPNGKRQERALNWVPMLARGGPELIDDMRALAGEHAERLIEGGHPERSSEGSAVPARPRG